MFKHILKIIWNRKKANALIVAEITIAFMVVFSLSALALRNYQLYQQPLGFSYQNMWRITVSNIGEWNAKRDLLATKQILAELERQPEIIKAQLLNNPTFKNWRWSSSYDIGDKTIHYTGNYINDGAEETFGMKLLQGRWFGKQDSAQNYIPILVNKRFVDQFFSGEDIIGKNVASDEKADEQEQRVIGVFEDFRQMGELSPLTPYVFKRIDLEDESTGQISGIELKMNPATKSIYEEKIQKLLKNIAPQWEFDIRTWESARDSHFKETLLPLTVLGIVGSFLMIMVAMGLFGVLWQNVTSRTQEIGLRRALGATAAQIQKQIISELIIVSLFGMVIAGFILVQLPMLGVFSELDWSLFALSFVAAFLLMLTLASLCAFYPGKMATKLSPAQALHYE